MLTHGHITRVLEYLSSLRTGRVKSLREYQMLSRCTQSERIWVEDLCDTCRLTRLSNGATEELEPDGIRIADSCRTSGDVRCGFRKVLESYIRARRPAWANRMPVGRQEAFAAMNRDERFCFRQAGLDDVSVDDDLVVWWDRISSEFRGQSEREMLAIGRRGERLTIEYEFRRTGVTPKWISVETNFAGYDILSVDDSKGRCPRRIEVKTSERSIETAGLTISRNEWDTASCSRDGYWFYLWCLHQDVRVAIVSVREMERHVATNNGEGHWMSIKVPFAAFSSRFVSIPRLAIGDNSDIK